MAIPISKSTRTKIRVLSATFLLNLYNGLTLYFGNLLPYLYSVFYNLPQQLETDISPSWMLEIFLICYAIATLTYDRVRARLGLRLTGIMAAVIYDVGYLLTYVTVTHSVWATTVTLIVLGGLGTGYLEAIFYTYLGLWFKTNIGMATCSIFASSAFGGVLINQFITQYINPKQLTPGSTRGHISFFSERSILDRVPNVFGILGCVAVCCHIAGFCLYKSPPEDSFSKHLEHEESQSILPKENKSVAKDIEMQWVLSEKNERIHKGTPTDNSSSQSLEDVDKSDEGKLEVDDDDDDDTSGKDMKRKLSEKRPSYHVNETLPRLSSQKDSPIINGNLAIRRYSSDKQIDKSPRDLLKSIDFYCLCPYVIASALGTVVVANNYKIYGQLWIADDNFFALLGSSSSLLTIVFQVCTGFLADTLGTKSTIILQLTGVAVFLSFWYFTAIVNKWVYLVVTDVLLCLFASQYVLMPMAALRLFGRTHMVSNFGLLLAVSIFVYLFGIPFVHVILSTYGWFWLFFVIAFICFIAIIPIVIRLPN